MTLLNLHFHAVILTKKEKKCLDENVTFPKLQCLFCDINQKHKNSHGNTNSQNYNIIW